MILMLGMTVGLISSCQKEFELLPDTKKVVVNEESTLKSAMSKNSGFVHGIKIMIDDEMYYFAGAPDGMDGAIDVPGHYWVMAGKNKLVGKHYNTGPFGMMKWWSSDAEDGALLYKVDAIIDIWTEEKAEYYAARGYVHYHEFVSVADGSLHPTKVPWLKHTAVTHFTLNGGPGAPNPPYEHEVSPGVDFLFPNNYMHPYNPETGH